MPLTRRTFVTATPAAMLGAAATPAAAAAWKPGAERLNKALLAVDRRTEAAYVRRVRAAGSHVLEAVGQAPQPINDDETALPGYVGNFSKCLPHDELGQVDPDAYRAYLAGLADGDLSGVPLAPGAQQRLANPTGADAFELHGMDGHTTRIAAAPGLRSALSAAEMIEVYWQALTRDVPFAAFGDHPLIAAAVADLNAAGVIVGPTAGGRLVTPATLFRGRTPGDLAGPYLSQFLWLPVGYGAGVIDQRYRQPIAGNDFMQDFDRFLAVQNGRRPVEGDHFEAVPRYLQTGRDLANYVHGDVLFQAYYNATIVILGYGGEALAPENPLRGHAVERGFVTFGGPDVLNLVATAARMALTGAWFQKWRQRRLRPEAFGARVEVQRRGLADYGLHPDVMASEAVRRTVVRQGNALLAQAFPEGSPMHPAYPAGHGAVAGACATVMKAFFDEAFVIPNAVVPTRSGTSLVPYRDRDLTLGGEIDKLANNISIGRNGAGVHYRSDGEQGMLAGEQQALGLLADYSASYPGDFEGFRLTRFDGTSVTIRDGRLVSAG